MKGKQRRKWLGLAVLRHDGCICKVCMGTCEIPRDVTYLGDCTAFNPNKPWKEVAGDLTEEQAQDAYSKALVEQAAKLKVGEEAKRAQWEKQCLELQTCSQNEEKPLAGVAP